MSFEEERAITYIVSTERKKNNNFTSVTQSVLNYSVEKRDFDSQNKHFV